MRYLVILFLCILAVHPLSYAKYNWRKKNRIGAVGAVLLAIMEVVGPAIFLFFR